VTKSARNRKIPRILADSYIARIWFSPEAAGYINEKIWHERQEMHQQDDGSIILEAEVAGTDEVKFWIMSWGSHALVLEPESLGNKIKAEAERVIGNYEREAKNMEGSEQEEKPLRARLLACHCELFDA
jgi:hypothetical protein